MTVTTSVGGAVNVTFDAESAFDILLRWEDQGGSELSDPYLGSPLRVAANNRLLEHANGEPFFYLANTIWFAPHAATLAELEVGFEAFRSLGFTVVQMCCTFIDSVQETPNRQGHKPFTGGNFSTPNGAYFDFVEAIVDLAATKGLHVALLPIWGSWQFWTGNVEYIEQISQAQCTSYGAYLGNRFAGKPNIIWMLGGDSDVSGIVNTTGVAARIAKWDALAAAIKAAGDTHLMTFHHNASWGFHFSNYPVFDTPPFGWPLNNKSWLSFSSFQAWPSLQNIPVYSWVPAFLALSPAKPTLLSEPGYEDYQNAYLVTANDVRQGAYWSVFAGAIGYTYGHISLYGWNNNASEWGNTHPFWYQSLNRPGATHMSHLRHLMESRPSDRVADDTLVTNVSSGANRIVGCRGANHAMIYIPQGAAFTANLAKISGSQVKTYWFNPRTGATTFIATYTNSGTQPFTPPSSGVGNDWVLMVDNAAVNFPVPGTVQ